MRPSGQAQAVEFTKVCCAVIEVLGSQVYPREPAMCHHSRKNAARTDQTFEICRLPVPRPLGPRSLHFIHPIHDDAQDILKCPGCPP